MLDLLVVSGDKFAAAYCRLASTPRVHTTIEAQPSNGSKKASMLCTGPVYHAIAS